MEAAAFIGVGALLAALGAFVGTLLGRYAWPATRGVDAAALLAGRNDAARLGEECRRLRDQVGRLEGEQRQAIDKTARLEAREAERGDYQERQKLEFENIAKRILKTNTDELSGTSQKALDEVLKPFRDRFAELQAKVEKTHDSETREVLSLKEQIRHLVETSQAVGSQADALAKALRGDSQLLGRWGELVLERILEAAGLTEGREYVSQGRGLGLRSDAGGVQKPDIIVRLPEERTMIIDSKVPLAGYERLVQVTDAAERTVCGSQYVRDVKGHIDGLSAKRYQENEKLLAHDCVLMFVPIEGALAAALNRDPELFSYAWDRRVVLVGPSTLLMTLRTVASIWRYELQGQNAQEIARLAGDLCDKVSMSLHDLNTVAEKMAGAAMAHNEAVKRLSTGRGNVLSIGQRIHSLGVKARRAMPAVLVDGVIINAEDEEPIIEEAAGE